MQKIGLYFGSFNPIHIGHLLVATHIKEAAQLDEIWFIISPQNPFKQEAALVSEKHRLEMTKLAIQNIPYFKVSDIEFHLSKPSYTHITLKKLIQLYPAYQFSLIIGADNLAKFNEWKEADWILKNVKVLVYNRYETQDVRHKISNKNIFKLPLFDISSTEIRNRLKENKNIDFFTTEDVIKYIEENGVYK